MFTDDYNIPESGNGVPDILDEAKWELDWMLRMQNSDGSVLSIAGHAGASPPSTDTSPCYYGSPSTGASLSAAAAFAYCLCHLQVGRSRVLGAACQGGGGERVGVGRGPIRPSPSTIRITPSAAASRSSSPRPARTTDCRCASFEAQSVYLFEATGTATYQQYFDANYTQAHLIADGNYADMFEGDAQEMLLDYTKVAGATPSVVAKDPK